MKSIIFHTEDILLFKSGLKSQICKPVVFRDSYVDNHTECVSNAYPCEVFSGFHPDYWWFCIDRGRTKKQIMLSVDVPYLPDEFVSVKETWNHGYFNFEYEDNNEDLIAKFHPTYYCRSFPAMMSSEQFIYRADRLSKDYPWKSARCMPTEAVRFILKITNTQAKRLQDLTDEDLQKQGYKCGKTQYGHNYWDKNLDSKIRHTHSWSNNPYVWVMDFTWMKKVM